MPGNVGVKASWHVTSPNFKGHLGGPRTTPLGESRYLRFGMSIASFSVLRSVKKATFAYPYRQGILAKKFLHHTEKSVEPFAHVCRFRAEENADCGGELREHQLAPWREPLSCPAAVIAAWSKQGSMMPLSLTMQELFNSTSSSAPVVGSTIETGTRLAAVVRRRAGYPAATCPGDVGEFSWTRFLQ
jgi:hypothetical protein